MKERLEDIKLLSTHFINILCERYGLDTKGIAPEFFESLLGYDWPGNVRELYQTMEQVFTASFLGSTCFAIHLPEKIRVRQARAGFESQQLSEEKSRELSSWRKHKEMCEKSYVQKLKLASENNISKACRISGLSRTRLYQLIQKYDVKFS
ncbi:AAA-type ATPase lid domain-containing protein [Desulfomarina profundi]